MGRGRGTSSSSKSFKNLFGLRKVGKLSLEEIKENYPFTGTCPVTERTADGRSAGQCCYATYGEFCPRHGNLSGRLVVRNPNGGLDQYERIDENDLPPYSERDMAPKEVFNRSEI